MSETTRLRVLYDGWALVHAPSSPAAQHLLALLAVLPPGIQAVAALPGDSPLDLPPAVQKLASPTAGRDFAHLQWEQRTLPRLARESGARLLHLFDVHPPLSSPAPVVASPATPAHAPVALRQVSERLRGALAEGAAGSLRAVFWPDDLDPPSGDTPLYRLPPLAHPVFSARSTPVYELEGCVLYHGAVDRLSLLRLLEGWGWVSGIIGEYNPLVLAGLTTAEGELAQRLIEEGDFGETVRIRPAQSPADWAALYAAAALVVYLGPAPAWGGALTNALAAGKPLVAWEDERAAQRAGPAAYLTPSGDGRALGAAISTLVVEEEMAATLAERARERAEAWRSNSFGARLADAYRKIVGD